MAAILFQNGRHEFLMSQISASISSRDQIFMPLLVVSGPIYLNLKFIVCHPLSWLQFFQAWLQFYIEITHFLNNAAKNNCIDLISYSSNIQSTH